MNEPQLPAEREPAYHEGDSGQLELLEPWEDDGLSLGEWMQQMPKGDQFRSLWWVT